jgi:hypothetical protein
MSPPAKDRPSRLVWLHPAFDIQYEPDGFPLISFGFGVEREGAGVSRKPKAITHYLVGSPGRVVELGEGEPQLIGAVLLRPRPTQGPIARLAQQWGLERFAEAQRAEFPSPSGQQLYRLHESAWRQHVHFDHGGQYVIAVCWGILSYVYPIFTSVPFLHFLGDKDSGKSQALDLLQELARDGLKVRPTPASVGDLIEARRPTLLLDQTDFLSDNMTDLMADSYRRGARRVIVTQPNGGRETREFETFGLKAFAGTQPLPDDLRDRAVVLHMAHSPRQLPPVRADDTALQATRAASYVWALWNVWALPGLRDVMMAADLGFTKSGENLKALMWPPLAELVGRSNDLWLPIECLMEALRVPDADRDAAREYYAQSRVVTVAEPPEERLELVEALWTLSNGKPAFTVTRSALERELNASDGDFAEPRWNAWKIGRQLNALVGVLTAPSHRARGRRDRVYEINQPALRDYARRYGLTE